MQKNWTQYFLLNIFHVYSIVTKKCFMFLENGNGFSDRIYNTCFQGLNIFRFANRIPLLFEQGADVVTRTAHKRIK